MPDDFAISAPELAPDTPGDVNQVYCKACMLIIQPKNINHYYPVALEHLMSDSHDARVDQIEWEKDHSRDSFGLLRNNPPPPLKLHRRMFAQGEIEKATIDVLTQGHSFHHVENRGMNAIVRLLGRTISCKTVLKGMDSLHTGQYIAFLFQLTNQILFRLSIRAQRGSPR